MKGTLALVILALTLTCSVFATDMYCHKTDSYTDVCEFSDGSAHVSTVIDDRSWSDWYTAAQWQAKKIKDARVDAANMTKEQKIDKENATIVATAKLCKKGDFNKGYCSAFATKHNLEKAGWDCLLMDGDFRDMACRYPVVKF